MTDKTSIFVICGEESGEILAESLLTGIKNRINIDLYGIGGHRLENLGLKSLFPMSDLSVMGIAEILPRLLLLLKRIDQTVKAIERLKPDLVITVDAPDFSFRVVKRLRERHVHPDVQCVHYVAPTVWAWRPGRAKKIAKLYDALLCLFPFEPPYFEREGLKSYFVGHPVLNSSLRHGNKERFRKKDYESLGILFGSRHSEIKSCGPIFAQTALTWLKEKPNRQLIIPTLTHLRSEIEKMLPSPDPGIIITDMPEEKPEAFAAMDQALAVSGTVGLELSVCNIPHIIGYKTSWMTALIIKWLVKTSYAHLTNIILDAPIIPEFLQEKCTVENLYAGLNTLDKDKQREAFATLHKKIEAPKDASMIMLEDYLS